MLILLATGEPWTRFLSSSISIERCLACEYFAPAAEDRDGVVTDWSPVIGDSEEGGGEGGMLMSGLAGFEGDEAVGPLMADPRVKTGRAQPPDWRWCV